MTWLWIVYALLITLFLAWIALVGLRFKGTLTQETLPSNPPPVTTIVPARNEERNITRCVEGLLRQDYPSLEMVFVDDDSRDATPDILAHFAQGDSRIRVFGTGGKPEDWNGKQWACHSGYRAAGGDWLCFMDADTYAEPELISRTVAFALANDIDFLTMQPWYEIRELWERIILPVGLPPLLLASPPHRVNDPDDSAVMANGQFILVRREVYENAGGHAGVRSKMMDDFSLSEKVFEAGHRVYIVDGTDVMRVRLYANLREIWNGWLKAAVEISGGWAKTLGIFMINLLTNILPFVVLVAALLMGNRDAALIMGLTIIGEMVYYGAIRMLAFRAPPWSAVTYPLGGLIVTGMMLDGMFRLATGQEIKWKDRPVMGTPEAPIHRIVSDHNR
jgi:glycosyltransferase involved in cell wall biosynthesis